MKKIKLLLIVFICGGALHAESLLSSLVDINDRWAYEQNAWSIVPERMECMDESELIQAHLFLVHQELKSRDVSNFTATQLKNRTASLGHLLNYAERGLFPENITHVGRRPIFIDHKGVHCAVGYLIKESGYPELSRHISMNMNDAYVLEMKDDALSRWVETCGFTIEELAWIQPGYFQPVDYEPLKGGVNGPVNTIISDNNSGIYAGGIFDTADGQAAGSFANYFSGFAGYDWMGIGGIGFQGEVLDAIMYHGELYVAGNFYRVDTTWVNSGVVKWDGSTWIEVGEFYVGALPNYAVDLEIYRDTLYAGGLLRSAPTATDTFYGIAKWDGTQWRSTGANLGGEVRSLHVHNNKLVIGGSFNMVDTAVFNLCMLNGNTVEYFEEAVDVPVNDIETLNNELYIATDFYNQAKLDTLGMAVYRNQKWEVLFNPMYGYGNTTGGVECMAAYNGVMLIGGDFNIAPIIGNYGKGLGIYRNGYVEAFGMVDSTVRCMTILGDQLYIGGDFHGATTSSGGTALNHIAQLYLPNYVSTETFALSELKVYPNPTADKLILELPVESEVEISLTDIGGKVHHLTPVIVGNGFEMNLSHLKNGTYVLTVKSGTQTYQQKVVVQ